ncbi:MAG: DUF389 domain-containing protein [Flavobacteriales bacterium]
MEKDINNLLQDNQPEEELKFSLKNSFNLLKEYLKEIINIRDGIDIEGSIQSIKNDIDFKGVNIWILGASIAIASVGLNVNSTAVIIGAMLISPLMGPIVGIGLAVGINSIGMLTRSLKSLGTAVLISVLVSSIYFLLTPFGEVQSELIARTRPNLLDVLIAFFGGMALIVAKTKKGTIASTIYGVSIATALMPPLCTAGYGLANGNWQFFFGAFYLFLINSVFIILATWLVVKYLRFPLISYIDLARQKKVTNYILIFSAVVLIPSGFTFWSSIQESIFKRDVENFIAQNFDIEGSEIISKKINYKTEEDNKSSIEVYIIGNNIDAATENRLVKKMPEYDLKNVELKIHQAKDNSNELANKLSKEVRSGILEDIYRKNEERIKDKDEKIKLLESQVNLLSHNNVPYNSLKKEIKLQYQEVTQMEFGKIITTDFSEKQDTIATFLIRWSNVLSDVEKTEKKNALQTWLRVRLDDEKVRVINY